MNFRCLPILTGFFVVPVFNAAFVKATLTRTVDPATSLKQLFIYNYPGEQLTKFVNYHQILGKHQIIWHDDKLQAGVYFCVLETETDTQTMKMIKLK